MSRLVVTTVVVTVVVALASLGFVLTFLPLRRFGTIVRQRRAVLVASLTDRFDE